MAEHGKGTCQVCGSRSTLTPMEIKQVNKELLSGATIRSVALQWEINEAAMRRHRWSHAEHAVVLDVRTDEQRPAFDTVDALLAAFDDADLIRRAAIIKGNHAIALRAMTAQQRLAKQLWADLGIDAGAVQTRANEFDALIAAIRDASRKDSVIARALAVQATGDLKADLELLHERAMAVQTKEAVA